jgi:hypothetical protein
LGVIVPRGGFHHQEVARPGAEHRLPEGQVVAERGPNGERASQADLISGIAQARQGDTAVIPLAQQVGGVGRVETLQQARQLRIRVAIIDAHASAS